VKRAAHKDGERGVRTIVVQSPSIWRETGGVIRAVIHIVFWSALIMTASWCQGRHPASATTAPPVLPVDEIAFRDLDQDSQRIYRMALEGLTEAEDARSRTNEWPTIEQLAARKIPPFTPDPLDRAGYRWRMLRDGTLVNYVGTPDSASKRPTFVISILEPDPGTPIDPQAIVDEIHHKLRDGTMIHVGVWSGTKSLDRPVATPAFEDGWRQIMMLAP